MAATTATGVGGDIILIPIIKICFDFGSVESIALSQIWTTISSFIRLVVTYKNRNPFIIKLISWIYKISYKYQHK